MNARNFGLLIRAVRIRKGLRQADLAAAAGVGRPSVSRLERGNAGKMTLEAVERIAAALDVGVELVGRWRGGDGERLLNRRHSLLADSSAAFLGSRPGWLVEPEVSFSIYGERGVIDQLGWHAATRHLLVIELKTEFVDVNEMLGTLDRKTRLARTVAAERGWRPATVSSWLIVADSRTNRRHASRHASLLRSRFALDGRSLAAFLDAPGAATCGMAFWTDVHRGNTKREASHNMTRVRAARTSSSAVPTSGNGGVRAGSGRKGPAPAPQSRKSPPNKAQGPPGEHLA